MNEKELVKLKEWYAQCPDKKIVLLVKMMLVVISVYSIYQLSYAVGAFICHIK